MVIDARIPKYYELFNPLLAALRQLGGSGTNDEIAQQVAKTLNLPDEIITIPHNLERSSKSELAYRLAWAQTYLKKYGVLENSERGVWALVPEQRKLEQVDPQEVVRTVRASVRRSEQAADSLDDTDPAEPDGWRAHLLSILTNRMSADSFERLTKRLLREAGFVQVVVTGKSGDGGIDGKGIMRLGGMLSFHVVFQCKRYKGSVSAGQIRDFRGAFVGRADKGLFITTGTFTADAAREATRDGAPPIDLIDGEQLMTKLKELGLGVATETVEAVTVLDDWFEDI